MPKELKPEHRLLIAPGDDVIPGQAIARRDLNPEERARLAGLKARIEGLERDEAPARRERLLLESELAALLEKQSTQTAARARLIELSLSERTQIRAGFAGRIERIEETPKGEGVSVGVIVR